MLCGFYGVKNSTQLQYSGLVAHEYSTFWNLALVVAEKCIFVRTILSQTPRPTPQVTYDANGISA